MTSATTGPDELLADALRARGQRVTPQRIVINRALQDLRRHASAEEVQAAAGERLPNVSLPTVYAALDLLVELGLARRVGSPGGPVLFDPRLDDHHHLVCTRCGRVEDLDAPVDATDALLAARRHDYAEARASLVVTGLCRDCR